MAIAIKEFQVPVTILVGETVQNAGVESANNMLTMQMFYDDEWGAKPRDLVLWFNGGTGYGLETSVYARPKYVVNKGFVYFNCSSFPFNSHPMNITLNPQMPIHDYIRYAFEVQSFIEYVYRNLVNEEIAKNFISEDSKICLTGTSRGAGNVLQWSNLSRGIYSEFKDKVVGIVANSPAGGDSTESWRGPYIAQRATFKNYQNVMHRTIGCIGAGDTTNTNRAHMERVNFYLTNPLVKITAEGNKNWGHSWPNQEADGRYKVFLDYAFGLLNSY